jgi:hypothetical protein
MDLATQSTRRVTMSMNLGKMGRTLLASAALVTASFAGVASAQTNPTFDPVCVQYFKNYCAANWQSQGFGSFTQCWEAYKLWACQYEYL